MSAVVANIVSVEDVTVQHAEKLVLDGVSIGFAERERTGVIGLNGSGKSTLLRVIAGSGDPNDGRVAWRQGLRVRYLPQEPDLPTEHTAVQVVMADPAAFDPLADRADAQREAQARAMLDRLRVADVDAAVGPRSGGERKRIALAAALVDDVDLLVLDEPTNHLDVDAIEWLEGHLRALRGALVMVTHDRYLLDRVCERIVEVHRGGLHAHPGSYGDYLEARALREEQAAAGERKRAALARAELAWLRRGPKARGTKAKHRVREAEALQQPGEPVAPEQARLEPLPARRLGGKVVNLHNAGVSLGGRSIVRGVDYKLAGDDRIGIVGPNGSGKTTLLRLIAGELDPDEGRVAVGETVEVGFYRQEPAPLPADMRVLAALEAVVRETNTLEGITVSAGDLLERFLFPAEAQKALVGELSGGERRRLELLRVLAAAPNLLLLDEPTNDLDLDTLGVLEAHLDGWQGALVVASHDRYFLDRTCTQLFSVSGGVLRHHPGGWSAYREQQRAERTASVAPRAGARPGGTARTGGRPGKLGYNEQRELAMLGERIAELEQRKGGLEQAVHDAGDDYEAATARSAELADVLAELDRAESRWLELTLVSED